MFHFMTYVWYICNCSCQVTVEKAVTVFDAFEMGGWADGNRKVNGTQTFGFEVLGLASLLDMTSFTQIVETKSKVEKDAPINTVLVSFLPSFRDIPAVPHGGTNRPLPSRDGTSGRAWRHGRPLAGWICCLKTSGPMNYTKAQKARVYCERWPSDS